MQGWWFDHSWDWWTSSWAQRCFDTSNRLSIFLILHICGVSEKQLPCDGLSQSACDVPRYKRLIIYTSHIWEFGVKQIPLQSSSDSRSDRTKAIAVLIANPEFLTGVKHFNVTLPNITAHFIQFFDSDSTSTIPYLYIPGQPMEYAQSLFCIWEFMCLIGRHTESTQFVQRFGNSHAAKLVWNPTRLGFIFPIPGVPLKTLWRLRFLHLLHPRQYSVKSISSHHLWSMLLH